MSTVNRCLSATEKADHDGGLHAKHAGQVWRMAMAVSLLLIALHVRPVSGAIIGAPGWIKFSGTLSDSDQVWAANTGAATSWSSVVLDHTFGPGEDFEVIASWAHNFIGAGAVYGATVSHGDYDDYSSEANGPYFGSLSTTGFPDGYSGSFVGDFPVPGTNVTTPPVQYYRWARAGNSLSVEYSATSASGPWTGVASAVTIGGSDSVVIGIGEGAGAGNEPQPLTLLAFPVPEPGSFLLAMLGLVAVLGCGWRSRRRDREQL
jgi:hypothetical protein